MAASNRKMGTADVGKILKQVLRKIFLDDWLLKLLALVITFGLWLGVTGLSTPATKRLTVQLAPNFSNNVEITNTPISEVDIVISGDERKLRPLTSNGLVAALDLTGLTPGDRVVTLTPDNVSVDLPPGVKLEQIQPSRIAIKLEAVEERELAVKADITGKPADGFEVYDTSIAPQRVRVRGPASFIRTLDAVLTDKINIAGKDKDFLAKQVPIGVANSKSTIFNTVVDVNIRIGEKRIEQLITIPASPQTDEKRLSVRLIGPRSALVRVKPAEMKVTFTKDENGKPVFQATLPGELQSLITVKDVRAL